MEIESLGNCESLCGAGKMRYKLEIEGEALRVVEIPTGVFPVKAEGFLAIDRKNMPKRELFVEIKDKNVLVWVKSGTDGV